MTSSFILCIFESYNAVLFNFKDTSWKYDEANELLLHSEVGYLICRNVIEYMKHFHDFQNRNFAV